MCPQALMFAAKKKVKKTTEIQVYTDFTWQKSPSHSVQIQLTITSEDQTTPAEDSKLKTQLAKSGIQSLWEGRSLLAFSTEKIRTPLALLSILIRVTVILVFPPLFLQLRSHRRKDVPYP